MIHLTDTDPYYHSKGIDCRFEYGELEQVQLTIQGYFELRYIEQGAGRHVFEQFSACCPEAGEEAEKLYRTKWLEQAAAAGKDISEVFDFIVNEICSRKE